MKRIILFTLLFLNYFLVNCQTWTSEELQKANTAINIPSITTEEKEVIKYINLARLYPQKFCTIEVLNYLGPSNRSDYLKTSPYKQSLIVELQNRNPVNPLYFDESMYLLALCFAKESSELGIVGHDRISCTEGYSAECCSYGHNEGKYITLSLLIDHNVPSLGHRINCLNASYDKVGASIQTHKTYGNCCVVDFKTKSREYTSYQNNQIKYNNPTQQNPTQNNYPSNNNQNTYYNPSSIVPVYNTKIKYNKLFSLKIGSSALLLVDDFTRLNSTFSNQLSYQINSMFGVNLGKSKKNTTLGLFGSYGKYNINNTTIINNNLFSSTNHFLEIEGGFLIKEFLRISGGVGYSDVNSINFSDYNYSSISTGFSFGPKWLKFDLLNTFIIPKDNQKVIYRPSVGISIVINFWKKYSTPS
jgi:hypothetical protein